MPHLNIERCSMSTYLATVRLMGADSRRWLRATGAPRPIVVAGLLAAVAVAMGNAPQAMLPAANAHPGQHSVVYQILGGGDVYSVIPDPGTPVYPSSTTT